jgi:hypothetical protein
LRSGEPRSWSILIQRVAFGGFFMASDPTGCYGAINLSRRDSCCLTHLVLRCSPRKTATIGVGPVLLFAWDWQWLRDGCHGKLSPQVNNMYGQREHARTACCHHGQRKQHFLGKTHLTTHCFDLFERPRCAFPARRRGNSTRASVSGRLRQGPKTVSLGAEIIHRVTAADRGFKEIAPELE